MEPRGLTEKQKRFADFYIETGNATDAARRAGYKKPNVQGAKNLVKVSIRTYVDAKLAELDRKRTANAKEVMEYLTAVLRGEWKTKRITPKGEEYFELPSRFDQMKAAENLMKRLGLCLSDVELEEKRAHARQMERDADEKESEEGVTIIDDTG